MRLISLLLALFISGAVYADFPDDFENVVWLHQDISNWSETAHLDIELDEDFFNMRYTKANVWPIVPTQFCPDCNANAWVFVPDPSGNNDVWYAATWEWLRGGQTKKRTGAINGFHTKVDPLVGNWAPEKGKEYGFMVSGLVRLGTSNVPERSNVVVIEWPLDPIPLLRGGGGSLDEDVDREPDDDEETTGDDGEDGDESELSNSDDFACMMVMCLYGIQNRQDGGSGCSEPLGVYKRIKKMKGTFGKVLDCPGTIKKRITRLSACKETDISLKDLVDCDE